MSVNYLLVFVVCQAAFVQPDGITLPFTFLKYKSLPTSLKDGLSTFENSENAENPTKIVDVESAEITNTPKTIIQSSQQQSLIKSVMPTNSKTVPNFSSSPTLDAQTKSTKLIENPLKLQSPNIGTAQEQKLSPINFYKSEESKTIKEDSISNNYSPKVRHFTGTVNNVDNNKNNNLVNLESSFRVGLNDVSYSTNKENPANLKPKYLDCNKQTSLQFERNSLNPVIQKFEKPTFVSKWDNIHRDNLNTNKNNLAGSDILDKLPQTENTQSRIVKNTLCNENIKLTQGPNMRSKEYPVDNIIFSSDSSINSNPVINALQTGSKDKMYTKSNLASIENTQDPTVTPLNKYGQNKVNSNLANVEVNDYDNNKNVASTKPVCPSNYVGSQIPFSSYYYGAEEMPNVYLPNGYSNPTKITTSPTNSNNSPASSIYKFSDSYNCVKDETLPDILSKSVNINPDYDSSKYLIGTDSQNNIPPITTCYTESSYISKVPDLSQIPDVYTPEMILSQPLSFEHAIFDDFLDTSCVNSLDNRFPKSIPNVDHTTFHPNEKLNLMAPLSGNSDIIPPYQPNCIHQYNARPTTYVLTPIKSNQAILEPPEFVSPDILPLSASSKLYQSNPKLTKTNLCSSPLTESLNNIISYFTTGLLSTFFNLNTKSGELLSTDPAFSIESDVPSSVCSETSVPVAMPLFISNSPQLSSPTSLPIPNIVLPLKESDIKSSVKRKSVVKKPKAYISSITINLIPANDVNDIIVFV